MTTATLNNDPEHLNWDNRFVRLGPDYGTLQAPTPIDSPYLIAFNPQVAEILDLDPESALRPDFAQVFSGNKVPKGAEPFSQVYSGHQFGVWAGQLGDGRAISLGQVRNARDESWDVQLKGAGETPYSRFADGRAVLRSTVREYLASAAMAGLGIPTTRALCIVGSDAPVYRETVETAAILTRLAPSHVRFGSFEHFFYRQQYDRLGPLADHVINEHFPHLADVESGAPRYQAWVAEVISRSAELVADWQAVGFCHGVLNTDNMSVLGLTLDYGPFGFLDHFDPAWICNHTDTAGRYAYDQQPDVVLWNLSRFVQAVLPLLADEPDPAVEAGQALLDEYRGQFESAYWRRMRAKLGLSTADDDDPALLNNLLQIMAADQADFTRTFRALGQGKKAFQDEFKNRDAAAQWLTQWRSRIEQEGGDDNARQAAMNRVNPKYVLRNYLAQAAIERAQANDYSEIERLHGVLAHPFDEQPQNEKYARLPPPSAALLTVSCSS